MKMQRKIIFSTAIICLSASSLLISGCKKNKDSTAETKDAPALPPKSGFVMSFSDFSNPNDTAKSAQNSTTYTNWGYSYLNVVSWNIALTAGLAVPVASYAEAFNHEAVYHPDANNWTWSYNVTVGQDVYEAKLTGWLVTDSSAWEMRVTRSGTFTDFLWYSGKSALSLTGGYWILKESPSNPNDLIKIDWHNYTNTTSDIRYTNIKPGSSENGGYIFYGTALAGLDRFYNIYNKGLDNHTNIEWSSTAKNGHVQDANHFGDANWHCWDNTLQDIVCP
jgi:hypothetical protein